MPRIDPAKLAAEIESRQSAYTSGGHSGQTREREPAVGSPQWKATWRARMERVRQIGSEYPSDSEAPVSIRADMSLDEPGNDVAERPAEPDDGPDPLERLREKMRAALPRLKPVLEKRLSSDEFTVLMLRLENVPVSYSQIAAVLKLPSRSHVQKLELAIIRKLAKALRHDNSAT